MMKICHLTSSHSRYDRRIFLKECKSLSAVGFDVSLIVADGKGNEKVDNITIYDVGYEKNRLKRLLISPYKIEKLTLKIDCSIFHFHDPELIFVGFKLKRKKKKVIFDMHEDIPAHISDSLTIPYLFKNILSYMFRRLEIIASKRFDAIISTRESINKRISKYNSNIEIITNYPLIDEKTSNNDNNNEEQIVSFAGGISANWQHFEIIKAIEKVKNIQYILVGWADLNYLKKLQTLIGWKKVDYRGPLEFDEVKSIYCKTNFGVAIHKYCNNTDGKKGNLANTKLFEYMYWGIPIICSDFDVWKKIIEDEVKCGICVNPYNIKSIQTALQFLIDNPSIAKVMGENGRKAVLKEYNWNTQAQKLVTLYNKITKMNFL